MGGQLRWRLRWLTLCQDIAFLPELAAHGDMGKVSAFGWTLGYVGGLLCLTGAAAISAAWPGAAGYRIYSVAHATRLRFILRARELGFSMEDIRGLIGLDDGAAPTCAEVKERTAQLKEMIRDGRLMITDKNLQVFATDDRTDFSRLVEVKSESADLVIRGFTQERVHRQGADFFSKHPGLRDVLFVSAEERIFIE